MRAASILALGLLLLASAAQAHQAPSGMEYSSFCCNGQDCAPIPAQTVRTSPAGYVVVLQPGDHPMVTERQEFVVPYGKELPSTDGGYHICLYPTQEVLRCFYAPGMGS